MNLPPFTQKPLFRRLALIPPALLAVILGVRTFKPEEALGARVNRGPISLDVRGTGTLESVQEVPLAFKVGGRILDLPLDEGASVAKGQVLGRLAPEDLSAQLAVAQAAHGAAEAGIGKAQADLEQARASQQRARSDFERVKRLQVEGILSRADLDAAQERVRVTDAAVQAMGAVGTQARRGESLAKGGEALQQLAFAESRLLSPVDGLLTRRLREPGNIVSAGMPVLTVVSTRKLWVRAWVDESALGRLQIGQGAQVELRSHPGRSFPGRVDRIGRQSDRQTHELLVDVEVLDLPPMFAMGQRADVRIQISGVATALRVPAGFLGMDESLWVERGGRARRIRPDLGFRGSEFVEVRSGLQEGERVLRPIGAGTALGAGRRVTVREGA
jgi:RND family efflux transporter MFP subunit